MSTVPRPLFRGFGCLLALLFLLCGSAGAETARSWVTVDNGPTATFSWRDVSVYAEPDADSRQVGRLRESPADRDDVIVEYARILIEGATDGESFTILEAWWHISSPVRGWVAGDALGLWNSGFLSGT